MAILIDKRGNGRSKIFQHQQLKSPNGMVKAEHRIRQKNMEISLGLKEKRIALL
jgi:hypothetical protein